MKMLGALLCAILGIAPLADSIPPYDPPSQPVAGHTIVTLNAHGSVDSKGGGNAGNPAPVKRDVLALAEKYKPDVIALQELCLRQHEVIKDALSGLGYVSTMTYARGSAGCNDKANGNHFGNALYIKAPSLAWRNSVELPWGENAVGTTGREPRRLLCARADVDTICVTHLSPSNPDRANQLVRVRSQLAAWGAGRFVHIAGDWNMNATNLSAGLPSYSIAGYKIDLIATTRSATLVATEAVPSSDHLAVVVQVGL